jgi:hypothetical protein
MDNEATKAIAITAGKGIDLAKQMGSFIGQFVKGPAEQFFGIWEDKLKYRRWENQISFMQKVQAKLKCLSVSSDRPLPMKVIIPLLEYAAVEDNDELQNQWANLLVNFSNGLSGVSMQLAYVEILKSLSPLEVKILSAVYALPFAEVLHNGVATAGLPERAQALDEDRPHNERELPDPSEMVCLALANLDRLGCVSLRSTMGGGQVFRQLNPTYLGRNFVLACTFPS